LSEHTTSELNYLEINMNKSNTDHSAFFALADAATKSQRSP